MDAGQPIIDFRKHRHPHIDPPVSRRRPWFRCKRCGRRLCQVDIFNGRTVIRAGLAFVQKALIICPGCGAAREFVSCPI